LTPQRGPDHGGLAEAVTLDMMGEPAVMACRNPGHLTSQRLRHP
jgi:hypothetical protein